MTRNLELDLEVELGVYQVYPYSSAVLKGYLVQQQPQQQPLSCTPARAAHCLTFEYIMFAVNFKFNPCCYYPKGGDQKDTTVTPPKRTKALSNSKICPTNIIAKFQQLAPERERTVMK